MYDQEKLLRALSDFAHTLVSAYEVDQVLADLTEQVSAVLSLATSGVTLNHDGTDRLVVALTPVARALEECQLACGSGPCLDAYRSHEAVCVPDLRDAGERWPDFVALAGAEGIVAVAGIPLRLADATVGALNLFADRPRGWSPEDLAVAQVFGDMATSYVINASKLDQQRQLNQQLNEALRTRIIIEQAKGIIAHEHNCTVDTAFEVMRSHARNHNAALQRVADAIVHAGLRI